MINRSKIQKFSKRWQHKLLEKTPNPMAYIAFKMSDIETSYKGELPVISLKPLFFKKIWQLFTD